MNKKIVLMLILVLCMGIVFVGCDKKIQVEFPSTPDGYDEEFWKESYVAYAVMKDVIDKDRNFTEKEKEYFRYYSDKDIKTLTTADEKELFGNIIDSHINILQSTYYKISKVEPSEEKSLEHKETAKEYLNKLDEFYKSLNK